MGSKLVNIFADYVNRELKEENIRNFVNRVLEKADDANAENPASSSGKYHPVSDMGHGGNVRHSILVAEIAKIMMRADPYYDEEFHREIVIASCILHDICKYKSEDTSHTQFEHATLAADLISETGKESKDYALISFLIAKNVATHMGRWNTSKYSSVELPKPHDEEQKLIHLADLISANKDLPNIINLFTKAAEEEMKDGK